MTFFFYRTPRRVQPIQIRMLRMHLLVQFFMFVDVDECLEFPCSTHFVCNNTVGSYTCTCEEGFALVEGRCEGRVIQTKTFRTNSGRGVSQEKLEKMFYESKPEKM